VLLTCAKQSLAVAKEQQREAYICLQYAARVLVEAI